MRLVLCMFALFLWKRGYPCWYDESFTPMHTNTNSDWYHNKADISDKIHNASISSSNKRIYYC